MVGFARVLWNKLGNGGIVCNVGFFGDALEAFPNQPVILKQSEGSMHCV
jgi:hypothetical protein